MSETSTDDTASTTVTAENIQRLDAGYFEHMQSLRDQVPVDEYMVDAETGRWSVIAMVLISLGLLVTFPFVMFQGVTYLVTLVYLIAFVVIGWVFYERIMKPNEDTETWSD